MKNDPQEPLEQFIDDALKGLPNVKAPPDLLQRVMTQVQLQPVPWWQSGWVCWPLAVQITSVLVIAGLTGLCVHRIVDLWSSELTALFLAKAGELLGYAAEILNFVDVFTRPFKTHLLLYLTVLFLLAPLIAGGIRTVWVITLNREMQNES